MATEAPPKLKKTWLDWAGPDEPEPAELLTRDELIAALEGEGVAVSVDDIRNWQLAGVIPYAVKRWRRDAVRSLYPGWMVDVVRDLRRLQAEGHKLRQIAPQLPVNERLRRAHAASTPVEGADRWAASNRPYDLVDIAPRLQAVAESHEHRTGTRISRVEADLNLGGDAPRFVVRLYDDRGHPLTYDLFE